jgi:nucleoside-diphosphate-sugar epimerase
LLHSGGSGFIAAHILDALLKRGHSVVTTVRSQEKAEQIKKSHQGIPKDKLDFVIVQDIANPDGKSDICIFLVRQSSCQQTC